MDLKERKSELEQEFVQKKQEAVDTEKALEIKKQELLQLQGAYTEIINLEKTYASKEESSKKDKEVKK